MKPQQRIFINVIGVFALNLLAMLFIEYEVVSTNSVIDLLIIPQLIFATDLFFELRKVFKHQSILKSA